jgi:hypothetical protein
MGRAKKDGLPKTTGNPMTRKDMAKAIVPFIKGESPKTFDFLNRPYIIAAVISQGKKKL